MTLLTLLDNPAFCRDLEKVLKNEVSNAELRDLNLNFAQRIMFVPKKFRSLIRKSNRLKRFLILIEKAYDRCDEAVFVRVKYFFLALLEDKTKRKKGYKKF